jgi:hypothetical protein
MASPTDHLHVVAPVPKLMGTTANAGKNGVFVRVVRVVNVFLYFSYFFRAPVCD